MTVDAAAPDASFPAGACDTHVHVYDARFPVAPAAVLRPPDASVDEYRAVQRSLGTTRVVVVQPTTYGLDNRCQAEAASRFGADARLVVVVDEGTPVAELERLHAVGARGARFHMLPGGAVGWDSLAPTAERIAELGWHVQLQLNGRELPDHLPALLALPTVVVVDHVGRFMPPVDLRHPAFAALLALLDTGRAWVKLSAPYESAHDGAPVYPAVARLARELVERFPERMLWATNWPHPGQVAPPSVDDLRRLAFDWLDDTAVRHRVLVDNPIAVYGFPPVDGA
jgi:D-galactarolactone isomerase